MPIKKILKIVAYIFVPLLPMIVAIYFLFPYINEEKHQEVTEKYKDEIVIGDTTEAPTRTNSTLNNVNVGEDSISQEEHAKNLRKNITELSSQLDSLKIANDSLKKALEVKEQKIVELKEPPVDTANAELFAVNSDISEEKFSENIKSLLDLDVENLTPIVNKMSDQQLVRIFEAASGLQRKKLLRSLESDRAAKLMTEVL